MVTSARGEVFCRGGWDVKAMKDEVDAASAGAGEGGIVGLLPDGFKFAVRGGGGEVAEEGDAVKQVGELGDLWLLEGGWGCEGII